MEKDYYIYVWYRNDNNEPFYVGKGKEGRYRSLHSRNRYFNRIYKKYGGYSKKIIENLTDEEALKKEFELIAEYKKSYKLANISDGGNRGPIGAKLSVETKEKISNAVKLQWRNPVTRERLMKARQEKIYSNPNFGAKISKANKGKKFNEQQRINHKKAMNNPETTIKLAKAKTKYQNINCISLNGECIKIFETTREAIKWLESMGYAKPNLSSVIGCIAGKNKTSYGFKWTAEKIKES